MLEVRVTDRVHIPIRPADHSCLHWEAYTTIPCSPLPLAALSHLVFVTRNPESQRHCVRPNTPGSPDKARTPGTTH